LLELAQAQKWLIGYQDECWWSRVSPPHLHSWGEADQPLRLRDAEKEKSDGEAKALCCYGLKLEADHQMLLRFVAGRGVSDLTIAFLAWVCSQLASKGAINLVMIWDNATWHGSRQVREWLKSHNQQVRADWREGKAGLRIIPCFLPVRSPWLNSIEPCWLHAKRAVVEPTRKLGSTELTNRVYDYFKLDHLPFIAH